MAQTAWAQTATYFMSCPLQMPGSIMYTRKNPCHILLLRLGLSSVWDSWHHSSLSNYAIGKAWFPAVQALALALIYLILWHTYLLHIYLCTYVYISIHIMYLVYTRIFMLQCLMHTIHCIASPTHTHRRASDFIQCILALHSNSETSVSGKWQCGRQDPHRRTECAKYKTI